MSAFSNFTLMTIGDTGILGSTVLKQFLDFDDFKESRIFSHNEKKQDDMRHEF